MIYFDNASTSFPKAPGLGNVVSEFLNNSCVNINRGSYSSALSLEEKIYDTRAALAKLFNAEDCCNIIFTSNITTSLNIVLKGLLKKHDHVLVSSMEHNAVMRPLFQLKKIGIGFTRIPCDTNGVLDLSQIGDLVEKNTRAIISTHASNVSGQIQPIKKLGEFAESHGLFFILDSAQTAGVYPVDMKAIKADAICFTGHKGLLGPQGIGGFAISNKLSEKISPLISGGTGSFSDSENIPPLLPDKFEAGTLNLPGIIGLNHAISYINDFGMENIRKHELKLTSYFLDGVQQIPNLAIVGNKTIKNRASIVSVTSKSMDIADLAFKLEKDYAIQTRVGLHCAPIAHKTLGTFPGGTLRFSFSHFNKLEEVDICLSALKNILN